jgi:hypothetical protein
MIKKLWSLTIRRYRTVRSCSCILGGKGSLIWCFKLKSIPILRLSKIDFTVTNQISRATESSRRYKKVTRRLMITVSAKKTSTRSCKSWTTQWWMSFSSQSLTWLSFAAWKNNWTSKTHFLTRSQLTWTRWGVRLVFSTAFKFLTTWLNWRWSSAFLWCH